jgi:hypothetical protein
VAIVNSNTANPGINTPTYNGVAMEVVISPYPLVNSDRLIAGYAIAVADADSAQVNVSFVKVDTAHSYAGKAIYVENVDPADLTEAATSVSAADSAAVTNLSVTNPDPSNDLVLILLGGFSDLQTVSNTGEGTAIGSAVTNTSGVGGNQDIYFMAYQSTGDATVAAAFTVSASYSRLRASGFSLNFLQGGGGGGGGGGSGAGIEKLSLSRDWADKVLVRPVSLT